MRSESTHKSRPLLDLPAATPHFREASPSFTSWQSPAESRADFGIHDCLSRPISSAECSDCGGGRYRHVIARLQIDPGCMGRHNHVFELAYRAGLDRRLFLEYIQTSSADPSRSERLDQVRFTYQPASRRVDQKRRRFHASQCLLVD